MHAYIKIALNLNMISIYKFYHCPSLLATPGFESMTFRPLDPSPVTLTTRLPPPPIGYVHVYWSQNANFHTDCI